MTDLRRLTEAEYDPFVRLAANAYPAWGVHSAEDRQRMVERLVARAGDPSVEHYGAFREGALVGGMALYDFTMNVYGVQVPTGGVGLVAVDLLHKKERVAHDLVTFFWEHSRARQAPLAALYPFRPDFYKHMGFGYGAKTSEYRVQPANLSLPQGSSKEHIAYLAGADLQPIFECYQRYQARRHGMMQRSEAEFTRRLASSDHTIVGYRRDGRIEGYLIFAFKPVQPDNFIANDLYVAEWVYETPAALGELLAFLHSQSDQVRLIVVRTQDEHFHHLLRDPRDGSGAVIPHVVLAHVSNTQGVGIMYRVLDTVGAFRALAAHNFGGQSCRLNVTLADSFFPHNAGSVAVHFDNGVARIAEEDDAEVEMRLDVAEFSSLLMGAVSFKGLHAYGLAQISNPSWLDTIDRLFLAREKPMCLTAF
jgi:predicted acetyltransferase